ncbi:hypothetical protein IKE67_08930 [bacterium]|nr:hypothetical protein [bacterium]
MEEIMKLVKEFDEYTKKLVGQLYYEGNLKNGKTTKKIRKVRANSNTFKA